MKSVRMWRAARRRATIWRGRAPRVKWERKGSGLVTIEAVLLSPALKVGQGLPLMNTIIYLELPKASLPTQGTEDDAPRADLVACGRKQTLSCLPDGFPSDLRHFVIIVTFARKFLGIGVVSKGGNRRVGDHYRLQMESAIAQIPG